MRFKDKVVVITGAASGIGLSSAFRFAEEGAELALIDKDLNNLDKANSDLKERFNNNVLTFGLDVSNEECVAQCIDDIVKNFGTIDVLFNNAGILDELGTPYGVNLQSDGKTGSIGCKTTGSFIGPQDATMLVRYEYKI